MTPTDMLDIRNKIENALKPLGWEGKGAGVRLCGEPSADIEGDLDGRWLVIKIRVRDGAYTGQAQPSTPEDDIGPQEPDVPGHEGAGHVSPPTGHTSPPTT